MMLRYLLLCVLSLLLLTQVFGQNFPAGCNGYVSPTGTDASNNCATSSSPCATIERVMAVSGTNIVTICMFGGTYSNTGNVGLNFDQKFLSFRGDGLTPTIIDCQGFTFGMKFFNSGSLRMTNITMTRCNGNVLGHGGALFISTVATTLEHMKFTNNTSPGIGGAISLVGAFLTVRNCTFQYNSAPYGGVIGGRDNSGVLVTDSVFSENTATSTSTTAGGAIYGEFGEVNVLRSTFYANTAQSGTSARGGAIWSEGPVVIIRDCTFNLNDVILLTSASSTATGQGGAVYVRMLYPSPDIDESYSRTLQLERNTFTRNGVSFVRQRSGNGSGGAVYTSFGFSKPSTALNVTISGNTFHNNLVTCSINCNSRGGGLYLEGQLSVDSTINNGLLNSSNVGFNLDSNTFTSNVVTTVSGGSALGGAIYLSDTASSSSAAANTLFGNKFTTTISNNVFSGNLADYEIGGVRNGSHLAITAAWNSLAANTVSNNLFAVRVLSSTIDGTAISSSSLVGERAAVVLNYTMGLTESQIANGNQMQLVLGSYAVNIPPVISAAPAFAVMSLSSFVLVVLVALVNLVA